MLCFSKDKSPVAASPWPFSSMTDLQGKLVWAWDWRSGLEMRLVGLDVRMRKLLGEGMNEGVGLM